VQYQFLVRFNSITCPRRIPFSGLWLHIIMQKFNFYQTTQCQIKDDSTLPSHHLKNLQSHVSEIQNRKLVKWFEWRCTNKCERKVQLTWKVTHYQTLFQVRRLTAYLTTTKFHILAASATVVQTVLQPAKSISFWGLLYSKLYITEAPSPGSHYKGNVLKTQNYKTMKLLWSSLLYDPISIVPSL
jgi:hypothetical protein